MTQETIGLATIAKLIQIAFHITLYTTFTHGHTIDPARMTVTSNTSNGTPAPVYTSLGPPIGQRFQAEASQATVETIHLPH